MAVVPLQTLILRRMAAVKHRHVADAIGTDESTISRVASGERGLSLDKLEPFLASLGLSVVEVGGGAVTVPTDVFVALQTLAKSSPWVEPKRDE